MATPSPAYAAANRQPRGERVSARQLLIISWTESGGAVRKLQVSEKSRESLIESDWIAGEER